MCVCKHVLIWSNATEELCARWRMLQFRIRNTDKNSQNNCEISVSITNEMFYIVV